MCSKEETKMKMKQYALVSLLMVLVMLISACVMPTGAPAAPSSGEGAAPQQIELLYMTHNHAPSIPLNESIIAEFEAAHPNVKITFDNSPHDNFEQKILTAFAGGQGPDIFWAGDWMVPQFVNAGIIAPVDPSAFGVNSQAEFVELFEAGSLDAFTVDGKIYTGGVSEYNTFSLIYNADMLAEAGLELSKDEPVTWEELADIAAALVVEEDGKLVRTGITWPPNTPIWTVLISEPMLRQLGGELMNPETGMPDFTQEAMVDVMTYMAELRSTNAVDPATYTNLLQDFAAGRSAMIIGGPWAAKPLANINPDLNWDTAPLPQFAGAEDRVTTLYSWAWFVGSQSTPEEQKVAWEFVNLLTSKQQDWWDTVGYVQARRGEIDGLSLPEYYAQSDERLSVIFNDYQYGKFQFQSPQYFELSDIWTRALSRVWTGEDIMTVLQDAQAQAEAAMQP
jgi:ABC-type glycerol-3-phosphate transport system substrate-binding protein